MKARRPNHPTRSAVALTALLVTLTPLGAETPARLRGPGLPRSKARLEPTPPPPAAETPAQAEESMLFPAETRSLNGRENNLEHPDWGAAGTTFLRMLPNEYGDGASTPAGAERPGARQISNAVMAQTGSVPNSRGATDYLWQWGQFLDHDITETPTIDPAEPFDIQVPAGDPWFDPDVTGTQVIPLNRSYYETVSGIRQQANEITAFIDASNVYGSSEPRAFALRMLDGSGRLKTTSSTHGDLLPYNTGGFDNAPDSSPDYFLAGDLRANEQLGLTAMHTLFVREHNHWSGSYRASNPQASDEEIYQFARMIVSGEMQHITCHEFLPVILGKPLPPYEGYRPQVNPGISNEFATAAYRFGHSLLSPVLLRIDAAGAEIEAGHLSLAEAFFTPQHILAEGIDPVLRGLAAQTCQELDAMVIDELRNFLFGPPGAGGLDLAALNIQRGRDHGLPSYNDMRRALGMPPARQWQDVNRDPVIAGRLVSAYQTVDDIDCWVGALCEAPLPDAMVGPLLHRILTDQFIRLRDGDRFWYQIHLPEELLRIVEGETLARIIRRNTGIRGELPDKVFGAALPPVPPSRRGSR